MPKLRVLAAIALLLALQGCHSLKQGPVAALDPFVLGDPGPCGQYLSLGHYLKSCYDCPNKVPRWIAYHVDRQSLEAGRNRRNLKPAGDFLPCQPSQLDFDDPAYEKGHMAAWALMRGREISAEEATTFLNGFAQWDKGFHRERWSALEECEKAWVEARGEVWVWVVLTGERERIGKDHRMRVPARVYKVLYANKPEPTALAFKFENGPDNPGSTFVDCSTTVNVVEQETGLHFFGFLGETKQARVKAGQAVWNVECEGYGKACKLCGLVTVGSHESK